MLVDTGTGRDNDDLAEGDLAWGMAGWASLDNPWGHLVKPGEFAQALDKIRGTAQKMILSAHLPPATEKTEQFLELLAAIPPSAPAIVPNQAALEQMLAQKSGPD